MDNRRIITEGLLGLFFIILSTVLLLYEGFKENVTLAQTEIEQRSISIERGAALFVAACVECHGLDGKGGLGAPFNDPHFFDLGPEGRLAEVGWGGSLQDFIIATVSGGRPVSTRPGLYPGKLDGSYAMPAWAEAFGGPFRPDQIRNLAHYILNWEAEATGEQSVSRVYLVPPSDDPLFAGRLVFNQFGCPACHTIEGIGGAIGPELTHVATNAATRVEGMTVDEYIRESILDPQAFLSPDCPTGPCTAPSPMPITFGDLLTDEQFESLIVYLLSLE